MALSENFKVLYFFSNEKEDLVEIKRLDVGKEDDPSKKYFWFFYDRSSDKLNHLNFVAMKKLDHEQFRQFDGLEINFDSEVCRSSSGTEYQCLKPTAMKDDLVSQVELFFNNY